MDRAALSCWVSHRVALLAWDLAFCEHRAAGARGTELSGWAGAVCAGAASILQGWGMEGDTGQMCLRRLLARMGQGQGAEPQWLCWNRVRTAAFHLGNVNLMSASLAQRLPHAWNVGRPRQGGLMELITQSFSAESPLSSRSTDTRLCLHGTLKQVVSDVGNAEQKSWSFLTVFQFMFSEKRGNIC